MKHLVTNKNNLNKFLLLSWFCLVALLSSPHFSFLIPASIFTAYIYIYICEHDFTIEDKNKLISIASILISIIILFCFSCKFYITYYDHSLLTKLCSIIHVKPLIIILLAVIIFSFLSFYFVYSLIVKIISKAINLLTQIKVFDVFIYCAFAILMIITLSNKKGFHEDEIFSYGLSNYQGGSYISIKENVEYNPAIKPFLDYVEVDNEYRFDFENVRDNQRDDVHPPLYYYVLHSICSLFPETFSIWYAGVINIIFSLFTLFYLRRIIDILFKSNYRAKTLISIGYTFTAGILSSVSFLRMYVMSYFFVTYISYLLLDSLNKDNIDSLFYIKLFITITLSGLTHYYCIIYDFLICIIFVIYNIKNIKRLINLFIVAITSGISAYSIFPPMIKHMFFGYRGTQSIDNIKNFNLLEYLNRIFDFIKIVDRDLFGGILLLLIIFIAILIIFKKPRKTFNKYLIITVPVFFFFLFVSKAGILVNNRYLYPIYPLLYIILISLIYQLIFTTFKEKYSNIILLILTFTVSALTFYSADWQYLYRDYLKLENNIKDKYLDTQCVYIYDNEILVHTSIKEVENYKSVTFVKYDNLQEEFILNDNDIIVIISNNIDVSFQEIKKYFIGYSKYEKLGSFTYTDTYLFSK